MLTADLDRLNVISSGGVVMMIHAKVCFPRGPYLKADRIEILYKCRLYLDTYSHKVRTF
jgi:hypothetical protein